MIFKMKNNKKSVSQMAFIIVAFALALLFLAIMSYIAGGFVKNFLKSIGVIQEQTNEEAECLVLNGGSRDKDGDGLHDTKQKSDGTICDPDPPT
jgi:hypothetical protein